MPGPGISSERRDQLAREYLTLPARRALRVGPRMQLPADEAESAALVGLAEAIDRYNPAMGEFEPFAVRTIDGKIKQAAREWRWRRRSEQQEGRELVAAADVVELIPDTVTSAELAEGRTLVLQALRCLLPLERQIIVLHGQLGYRMTDVAKMLDQDVDRCRYLWRRGLNRMRAELGPIAA